jgi:hypothetical protein
VSIRVFLRQDERVDLLAHRDLVGGIDRLANRELLGRDDALRLVADVDEHLVLVDAHDGAVHDLPLVDLGEGRLVVGDQLAVGACDPDAFFGFRLFRGDIARHRQEPRSIATRAFRPSWRDRTLRR